MDFQIIAWAKKHWPWVRKIELEQALSKVRWQQTRIAQLEHQDFLQQQGISRLKEALQQAQSDLLQIEEVVLPAFRAKKLITEVDWAATTPDRKVCYISMDRQSYAVPVITANVRPRDAEIFRETIRKVWRKRMEKVIDDAVVEALRDLHLMIETRPKT